MKTLVCLLIATLIGRVLQYAGVPHGLLLGSILATALIVSNLRFAPTLRFALGYVQIVLGIATGLMFESWNSQTAATMLPSLGIMLLCLSVQIVAGSFWLFRVSGWNLKDSLLAVYPGALAAVFDLLESERASNKVIVVHLVRLLSITLLVTLLIPGSTEVALAEPQPLVMSTLLTLLSLIVLCLALGRVLLRIGVPAPFMLTAIVSTALYIKLGYLHAFQMPPLSIEAATILLGVLIGSKFKDITFAELIRHGRAGLLAVALMLLIAATFAGVAGRLMGNDPLSLWLAYMPGAIETIAIVAFSGGLNVVFILTHHLVRMVALHFAPALIVQARRWRVDA
ncbi:MULTISPECIES: AbrB family transcriptional regulator [unclassified Pseudomonas]|uniref:AbrB family transcriptional regulator n=1 Tax=unclassified Pseudomonas TaxID=196821 RepID=UPI002AC9ADB6|nr:MULTISPECIES: AbrB family transcriptional regulator [unclassified Pseudomonas]MEB0045915.1 AbrB family transcriptional regulator [Pseudomonas sp. Dout3]MEB0097175.1 AbrB family transcriptional regulator [Pseudomonas sp. DC1.2]WPX56887.1 AbrB family transcriptional regulator [Pseudomonas sp. DC1.2]